MTSQAYGCMCLPASIGFCVRAVAGGAVQSPGSVSIVGISRSIRSVRLFPKTQTLNKSHGSKAYQRGVFGVQLSAQFISPSMTFTAAVDSFAGGQQGQPFTDEFFTSFHRQSMFLGILMTTNAAHAGDNLIFEDLSVVHGDDGAVTAKTVGRFAA